MLQHFVLKLAETAQIIKASWTIRENSVGCQKLANEFMLVKKCISYSLEHYFGSVDEEKLKRIQLLASPLIDHIYTAAYSTKQPKEAKFEGNTALPQAISSCLAVTFFWLIWLCGAQIAKVYSICQKNSFCHHFKPVTIWGFKYWSWGMEIWEEEDFKHGMHKVRDRGKFL